MAVSCLCVEIQKKKKKKGEEMGGIHNMMDLVYSKVRIFIRMLSIAKFF